MFLTEEHFCTKYDDLCASLLETFASFMWIKHDISTIVFDGYSIAPSTKDHEHARKDINKWGCVDVQCNVSTKVNIKQGVFLSVSTSKSRFIDILSSYLIKSGKELLNSDEDAETEIARCTLHVVETGRRANVVADDTDVALLLLHHWKSDMANTTFASDLRNQSKF